MVQPSNMRSIRDQIHVPAVVLNRQYSFESGGVIVRSDRVLNVFGNVDYERGEWDCLQKLQDLLSHRPSRECSRARLIFQPHISSALFVAWGSASVIGEPEPYVFEVFLMLHFRFVLLVFAKNSKRLLKHVLHHLFDAGKRVFSSKR